MLDAHEIMLRLLNVPPLRVTNESHSSAGHDPAPPLRSPGMPDRCPAFFLSSLLWSFIDMVPRGVAEQATPCSETDNSEREAARVKRRTANKFLNEYSVCRLARFSFHVNALPPLASAGPSAVGCVYSSRSRSHIARGSPVALYRWRGSAVPVPRAEI